MRGHLFGLNIESIKEGGFGGSGTRLRFSCIIIIAVTSVDPEMRFQVRPIAWRPLSSNGPDASTNIGDGFPAKDFIGIRRRLASLAIAVFAQPVARLLKFKIIVESSARDPRITQ